MEALVFRFVSSFCYNTGCHFKVVRSGTVKNDLTFFSLFIEKIESEPACACVKKRFFVPIPRSFKLDILVSVYGT